jgi:predicted RNA-binding Zn-ribbon protein involved in translation (DUF1610 family)
MTTLTGLLRSLTRKRLHSLADWNEAQKFRWDQLRDKILHPENHGNGFECPECLGELHDTGQALSTKPTILRVKCKHCGYRGQRYE